jgi:hypothetical protein
MVFDRKKIAENTQEMFKIRIQKCFTSCFTELSNHSHSITLTLMEENKNETLKIVLEQ